MQSLILPKDKDLNLQHFHKQKTAKYTHPPGFVILLSASSSHFCSNGFSLHIFLKLKFNASNLDMVVCEKSFPYSLPIANPTSPWVKPNLIRRCLNVFANCSSSSKSVVSSGDGSIALGTDGSFCI